MNRLSKTLSYIIGISLCCACMPHAVSQTLHEDNNASEIDTLVLSESDVLRIALSENATVKVADMEVRKQEYARKIAYADLFPKIDLNGIYSHTLKKQVLYFDFPGAPTGDGIEVGRTHNTQGVLNLSMPLVSLQIWKSIAMTKEQLELQVEKARSSRLEMVAAVKKAYLSVLLAEESYSVFKRSYDNAQINFKNISDKFDQGLVAEYEKIRANVQVYNIEPNLIQAENSVSLALWQLKVLMNMDVDEPIKLSGSLADYKDQVYEGYFTADTLIRNNSSLRQLDMQRRLAVSAEKLNKLSFFPTLSLSGHYTYMLSSNDFKFWGEGQHWTPFSTISLNLSIPIFNGGKRLYKTKESAISVRAIDLQRHNLEQSLRMGIKNQKDVLHTCMRRFVASEEAVGSAEKGYQIAKKRYETGVGTLVELNDADVALLQARLNYNQAIFDFMTAKTELDKMNGLGIPELKEDYQINN